MGCYVYNVLIEILDSIFSVLSGDDITSGIISYTICDHTLINIYIVVRREKLLIGSAVSRSLHLQVVILFMLYTNSLPKSVHVYFLHLIKILNSVNTNLYQTLSDTSFVTLILS